MVRPLYVFLVFVLSPLIVKAQTIPCTNGMAGDYPCNNVSLVAHVNPQDLFSEFAGEWANDIWGWTDPTTSIEYVLFGVPNGTTFIDISNPESPQVLGFLPSHNGTSSPWRDIKVYNNHAFIVSEANGHGMQVFDLTRLRDMESVPETFTADAHYDGISNAHNIVINTETGFAYATGATRGGTCSAGGLHIINIQDPVNPTYAGCFDADGYTHDAQCIIYDGPDTRYTGQEICFNSNEDAVTIADVTDKNNIDLVGTESYSNVRYTHQGWLTADHQYFLSNDELDELETGIQTRTLIWDVRDLENPTLIGEYFADNTAVDHNLYIHNGFVFESNYRSGLRILQTASIADGELSEIAFFDSFPSDDFAETSGNWSNYPFFESGIVAISDMDRGLFLLRPSLDFYISRNLSNMEVCESASDEISISVVGDVESYQWQIDMGDGFENITNGNQFSGSQTASLMIDSYTVEMDNSIVRCIINNGEEEIITNEASINVTPLPVGEIQFLIDDLTVDIINASTDADEYSWDFGDGSEIVDQRAPRHIYDDYGIYTVTFTATNECGDDVTQTDLVIAITSSRNELENIKVYPIPATDLLTIQEANQLGKINQLRIVDTSGKSMNLDSYQLNDNEITIPIGNFKNGLYFLTVEADNGTLNRRFLITR